jgi:SAM-dependent methyltransferase
VGERMKKLDDFDSVKRRIDQTDLSTLLFPHELNEWVNTEEREKNLRLQRICDSPLCDEDFTVVYSLYMRMKWVDALKNCISKKRAVILEVGSGSSANIPNAVSVYDSTSKYITVNMNKRLTEGLKRNTAALPIAIEVIEDDANNIQNHLPINSIDTIVFEHSVNDILQAILCERNGIDTVHNDWFSILPHMTKIISEEYVNQTLEQSVKPAFLSMLENCLAVLKPGGHLIMSHYMFQYDLDLGYNPELWENMLPIIRPWLKLLSIGNEVFIDTFNKQWWLFYQK